MRQTCLSLYSRILSHVLAGNGLRLDEHASYGKDENALRLDRGGSHVLHFADHRRNSGNPQHPDGSFAARIRLDDGGHFLGVLSAANATGQLVFLPVLARLVTSHGWRSAVYAVAGCAVFVFLIVFFWMKDRPSDAGLLPYGALKPSGPHGPARSPLNGLAWAAKSREFWILAGSFFVCGASTNGLIGTHLIPACMDHGIAEVRAAGLLAVMGIFDLAGTTFSGWLTDRFNSRYLLFWYYALRGISLLFLPFSLAHPASALSLFAVFYGLDWVATVPPTVRLTANTFGKENVGVVYGWIGAAHQLGASLAALGAGSIRTYLGDYRDAFWVSGALCLMVATLLLSTRRETKGAVETGELVSETAGCRTSR